MSELRLPPLSRTVLGNGLTIVVVERRQLPLVTMRLTLRAGGSRDPERLPGLAALTARLLRHGSGARDSRQFAAELDAIGGHFGTGTGLEQLTIDGEFMTETLDKGLDLYLTAIRDPRFSEHDVEREKGRMAGEIVQSRDEPDSVADEAFHAFLFKGHPHGHPVSGTVSSVTSASREDVVRHHGKRMTPAGAVLVVVGDVDREAFLARIASSFESWHPPEEGLAPIPEPKRLTGRKVVLVHDEGSGQVQYRTGNVGVARTTPHWYPLMAANTIFGGGFTSRLVREVRVNRGLTYGVHSRVVAGQLPGAFAISTFTKNESLAELHEVVVAQVEELHARGVTAEELDAARSYLAGITVRRLETPEALAAGLTEAEIFGLDHAFLTRVRAELDAVTPASAAAAIAAAVPRPDDLLTVLVGDRDAVRETARTFGELVEVEADFAEGSSAPGPFPARGGGAGRGPGVLRK